MDQLFSSESPALLIHCAAISKNPACEANPELARRVNFEATAHLAGLAENIPFYFFSTDLVFDGTKGNYVENDRPNPLSVYGETKVDAEESVARNPGHTIVRISLNGGVSPTRDRGFNEEMRRAWSSDRALNLFVDEYRCPMAAEVTARAVWELVTRQGTGLYHLCGSEKLSRYEIGKLLAARHPELNPQIIPGSRQEYKGPPRPPDTSLDCTKVQRLLNVPLPRFSEWLKENPRVDF